MDPEFESTMEPHSLPSIVSNIAGSEGDLHSPMDAPILVAGISDDDIKGPV